MQSPNLLLLQAHRTAATAPARPQPPPERNGCRAPAALSCSASLDTAGFQQQRACCSSYMTRITIAGAASTGPTCVFTSTCDGSTVMCGWLWYQPTTRVGSPVLALTCSASALQAAICSGLVSTRSCRCNQHRRSRQCQPVSRSIVWQACKALLCCGSQPQ
jgi:hypothetical protein